MAECRYTVVATEGTALDRIMSALPPKADIPCTERDVRLVPSGLTVVPSSASKEGQTSSASIWRAAGGHRLNY